MLYCHQEKRPNIITFAACSAQVESSEREMSQVQLCWRVGRLPTHSHCTDSTASGSLGEFISHTDTLYSKHSNWQKDDSTSSSVLQMCERGLRAVDVDVNVWEEVVQDHCQLKQGP